MNELLLAFIPMFFAMDPVGLLPVFAALTHGMDASAKNRVIRQSLVTAAGLAVVFIFTGRALFNFLGITMGDFMVAGGAVLFWLSMRDMTNPEGKSAGAYGEDVGAVPIGTPLMVGPAVLAMSLILMNQYGVAATLGAVLLNVALAGVLFSFSTFFIKVLGSSGSRTLSKVLSLLLAAIGVMMIRRGIIEIISGAHP